MNNEKVEQALEKIKLFKPMRELKTDLFKLAIICHDVNFLGPDELYPLSLFYDLADALEYE